MTKNYFLLALIFISQTILAQNLEIAAGAGSGAYYIFEEADDNSNISYDGAASLYLDLKYNFNNIEGLKLRLLNTSTSLKGQDYQTRSPLDGTVDTYSFLMLYERLRTDKKFNVGYNFGLGHTIQNLNRAKNIPATAVEDRFMSVNLAGVFSVRLNNSLRLNAETGLLWTDPINTFRGSYDWQTAGEDLSFLVQVGLSYPFLKDEQ